MHDFSLLKFIAMLLFKDPLANCSRTAGNHYYYYPGESLNYVVYGRELTHM